LFLIVAGQRAIFQAADKVVDILRINAHLPEISLNALRIGHTDLITERIHIGFHLSPRGTFMARCEKDAAKEAFAPGGAASRKDAGGDEDLDEIEAILKKRGIV